MVQKYFETITVSLQTYYNMVTKKMCQFNVQFIIYNVQWIVPNEYTSKRAFLQRGKPCRDVGVPLPHVSKPVPLTYWHIINR